MAEMIQSIVENKSTTNDDVIKYLEANPSFFLQNSALLTKLNLPNTVDGNIANFNDFQARKLKQKVAKYEERIALLMRTAILNENSGAQLHQLILQILEAENLSVLKDVLLAELKHTFGLDYISFEETHSTTLSKRVTLKQVQAEDVSYHIENGDETYSEAWLRLEDANGDVFAAVMMASKDPQRFYDGQGDTLLDFFAQVLSYSWLRFVK